MAGMNPYRVYSCESASYPRCGICISPFAAGVSIHGLYFALDDIARRPSSSREASSSSGGYPVPHPRDLDLRIRLGDLFRRPSHEQHHVCLSPRQYRGYMWWTRIVSPSPPLSCRAQNAYHKLTPVSCSVNVFYRINQERPDPSTVIDTERSRQEREFKIGSLGFSDSSGILLASLLAVPTEVQLCKAQTARMKMLCKGL